MPKNDCETWDMRWQHLGVARTLKMIYRVTSVQVMQSYVPNHVARNRSLALIDTHRRTTGTSEKKCDIGSNGLCASRSKGHVE